MPTTAFRPGVALAWQQHFQRDVPHIDFVSLLRHPSLILTCHTSVLQLFGSCIIFLCHKSQHFHSRQTKSLLFSTTPCSNVPFQNLTVLQFLSQARQRLLFCVTEPSPYYHLRYFRLILNIFLPFMHLFYKWSLEFISVFLCKSAYAFIAFRHTSYLLVSIPFNSLTVTKAGQYLVNTTNNALSITNIFSALLFTLLQVQAFPTAPFSQDSSFYESIIPLQRRTNFHTPINCT